MNVNYKYPLLCLLRMKQTCLKAHAEDDVKLLEAKKNKIEIPSGYVSQEIEFA